MNHGYGNRATNPFAAIKSVVQYRLCRHRPYRPRADSALSCDLTVGATTYQPRYDECLVPLLRNGLPNSLDSPWVVAINGISPNVPPYQFLRHEWLKPEETSFEGERIWDKYSMVNRGRFVEKWAVSDGRGEGLYLPQIEKSIRPATDSLDVRPHARGLNAGAGGAGYRWVDLPS